jgi:3-deoxy-D-manno-octulosonate 8-phosphate phosphatase (KDO 8-P phosphatase)
MLACDETTIEAKARRVRLLLFDVDGVLTDGKVLIHPDGSESKQFAIKDGIAIVAAERSGLLTGVLSGRASAATGHRAQQLGMSIVHENVATKVDTYLRILATHGLRDEQVAYMGDDLLDLPVLLRAGLSAAPSDAVSEVRERVHWVSLARGGEGAARELVELVLRAQGKWNDVVDGCVGRAGDEGPGPSAKPGRKP